MPDQVGLEVLRRLASVSARINSGNRLEDTLQAVADGVVEAVGFGCAAVNYRLDNGDFEVMAVVGPPEARRALQGVKIPKEVMEELLERCEHWGALRHAPHVGIAVDEPVGWIPDLPVSDAPDAWHPEDALFAPLHDRDDNLIGVLSVDLPPGQRRPGKLLCELLEMFAGQASVAIQNARLTDELRREHERLRASEAAFRFAFDASAGAMATVSLLEDDLGRFLPVNDAFCRILGYNREQLAQRRWPELVAAVERHDSEAMLTAFATGGRRHARDERRMVRNDGAVIWAGLTATVVAPGDAGPPFLLVHLEDISERKSQEDALTRQAGVDPLTGLANRRVLFERLRQMIAEAVRTGTPGAVLYCDLDGFKQINDHYGHAVGDRVLQEAAGRLAAQVRASDLIGRLGGDEFVIVAPGLPPTAADELVERVRAAFGRPVSTVPAVIDISIGVAAFGLGSEDAETLLDIADRAMYADKHRQRLRQRIRQGQD